MLVGIVWCFGSSAVCHPSMNPDIGSISVLGFSWVLSSGSSGSSQFRESFGVFCSVLVFWCFCSVLVLSVAMWESF